VPILSCWSCSAARLPGLAAMGQPSPGRELRWYCPGPDPAAGAAPECPDRTQTLRSDQPERSARLVWPEVPAELQRALEHVPFAWIDLEPGRPETLYHPAPVR